MRDGIRKKSQKRKSPSREGASGPSRPAGFFPVDFPPACKDVGKDVGKIIGKVVGEAGINP